MNSPVYEVRRTGKTWGVYVDGKLREGGFFSKQAAVDCRDHYFEDEQFPGVFRRNEREDFGADNK